MKRYRYIIGIIYSLICSVAFGQENSNIILHADSNDKYILVYKKDIYTILIGYNAFTKSKILDSEYVKGSTVRYIDSMKKYRNIIYLNSDSICSDSLMVHDFVNWDKRIDIFQETQVVIANLIDLGNARIYNRDAKRYLNYVVRRKEKWRNRESWGYGHESRIGESWFYRDNKSHKIVFEALIWAKTSIKEKVK